MILNICLGRDMPLSDIVEACKAKKAIAVGTFALTTSTMVGQKALEGMLKKAGIRKGHLTNVGGAPVIQKCSDEIGVGAYSENASDAVVNMKKAFAGANKHRRALSAHHSLEE